MATIAERMPRRRLRTPTRRVVFASVVTAAALGWMAGQHFAHRSRAIELALPSPQIPPSNTANTANPAPSFRWGIPTGFAHSEDGAIDAAASYVLTGKAFMDMPPSQLSDAIELMFSTPTVERQLSEAQSKLTQLRDALSPGTGAIHYAQAVLAVRLEAYTPERARVSVWSVGVLSRDGAAVPQAGWTTSTFDLVWERDDWKVWSESIAPGPTPDLNASDQPASSADLDARIDGFVPWRGAR